MRYTDNPELLAHLADAFVVGTLSGRARRRLERLCQSDPKARIAVHAAEDRLVGLSMALKPVQPSAATWRRLAASMGAASARPARGRNLLQLSAAWRMTLAAGVAALALGIAWLTIDHTPRATMQASVSAESGRELWTLNLYGDRERLTAKVSGSVPRESGRSYELWALPEGGAPVSLGLLPEAGAVDRRLTEAQRAAVSLSTKVAVSLEPAGGSRTGAPTGPVLYVANLRSQAS